MNSIDAVLEFKGRNVHSIAPTATIADAVEAMCRVRIGALLVLDRSGTPIGIISERDLLVRVLLDRRDPRTTVVGDVMTHKVMCIESKATIPSAFALMTHARCRHLPVVERGKVVGLVSIGDLARVASADQEYELRMLQDYVSGKYPG